jgi:hypothetical protein
MTDEHTEQEKRDAEWAALNTFIEDDTDHEESVEVKRVHPVGSVRTAEYYNLRATCDGVCGPQVDAVWDLTAMEPDILEWVGQGKTEGEIHKLLKERKHGVLKRASQLARLMARAAKMSNDCMCELDEEFDVLDETAPEAEDEGVVFEQPPEDSDEQPGD